MAFLTKKFADNQKKWIIYWFCNTIILFKIRIAVQISTIFWYYFKVEIRNGTRCLHSPPQHSAERWRAQKLEIAIQFSTKLAQFLIQFLSRNSQWGRGLGRCTWKIHRNEVIFVLYKLLFIKIEKSVCIFADCFHSRIAVWSQTIVTWSNLVLFNS